MAGTDVKKFLIKLMEIDSTTGKEEQFGNFVADTLQSDGWTVEKNFLKNSTRFNVLATRKPLGADNVPRLLLNTHLDTVPPFIPPTCDDTTVYGRGSNDAKGQLACMVLAANRIVNENPALADQLALLFVVGEEVDHVGMLEANSIPHLSPEYIVVGEPTELKFASLQKGALKFEIHTKGKAGHSGYPHTDMVLISSPNSGTSAVHKLVHILNDILVYDWPKDDKRGDTTVNIGMMNGGHALNAWANHAQASIFIRVTTSVDDVKKRLEGIVGDRGTLSYPLGGNDPVVLSPTPFEFPTAPVAFNTDLPYYANKDKLKGAYLFGAGSITTAHSVDEHVLVADLEKAVDVHYRLAVQLLEK